MKINLKKIPAINKLLDAPAIADLKLPRNVKKFFITKVLTLIRQNKTSSIKSNITERDLEVTKLSTEIQNFIARELPINKAVINGTGIILHTGLGRAPLSHNAINSLKVAAGYNLVQADRSSGARTVREELIEDIIRELTGAEATTVVNNNAAATFLMLNAICKGKEVIISRGQQVEIGGSYRMPDIINESGCIMREVGTTNKTHLKDYETAINENTGALLFVHQSNFKIAGFTSFPSVTELCDLGKKYNVPVLADLGAGALIDLERFGLQHEETVKEILSAGVDLCCYSGDKLIGGPQSGLISGSFDSINKIRSNTFSRMFRVCKLTLRSLESTLLEFLDCETVTNVPLYKSLAVSNETLEERGIKILNAIRKNENFTIISSAAYVGSGSLPTDKISSRALSFKFPTPNESELFANKLRFSAPAVFPRISNSEVIIDLRTVDVSEDQVLTSTLKSILKSKIG